MMKHLHKIKPTFISIFPLNTNLFEMLSSKLLKNLAYGLVFQHTSRCFDTVVKNAFSFCIYYISNSLIIHEENTKEINTETEFGYVMKHLHKINLSQLSSQLLRCYIKNSEECFIRISKHLEVVKKLGLRPRFSTHFSGFEYPDETLFLMFDILHFNCICIL